MEEVMRFLRRFTTAVDSINDRIGKFFSLFIIGMVLTLIYEVVLRYVFDSPTMWAHETSQYFWGAYFMMAGAYTLRHHAHVNVEILFDRFSPRTRAIIDVFTSLFFFLFCGLLFWNGWELAWDSLLALERSQTPWSPPVYPAKLMIPLGGALILIQGFVKLIRDTAFAIGGKEMEWT